MNPSTPYKSFGEVIRHARTQLNRTQVSVATQVGLTKSGLCRIENGERHAKIQTAAALLSALTLDSGYLMRTVCEQSAAHSGLGLDEFQTILNGPAALA